MSTAQQFDRQLKHAWLEPKHLVAMEAPSPWFWSGVEPIDPDWWEPRHDQPWRRQVARNREEYGGEYVASAKPPVEGPNNPNRLRRELKWAEDELRSALVALRSAEDDEEAVRARIRGLKGRIA